MTVFHCVQQFFYVQPVAVCTKSLIEIPICICGYEKAQENFPALF